MTPTATTPTTTTPTATTPTTTAMTISTMTTTTPTMIKSLSYAKNKMAVEYFSFPIAILLSNSQPEGGKISSPHKRWRCSD